MLWKLMVMEKMTTIKKPDNIDIAMGKVDTVL